MQRGGTEASPEAASAEALGLANAPGRAFSPPTSLAVGTKKGGGGGGGGDGGEGEKDEEKAEGGGDPVEPPYAFWDIRPSVVQPVEPPCPCHCECVNPVVTDKLDVAAMVLDGVAAVGRLSNPWSPLVNVWDVWQLGPFLATPNASFGGVDPSIAKARGPSGGVPALVVAATAGVQAWPSSNAQTMWVGPVGLVVASLPPKSGLATPSPPSAVPALAGAAGTPGAGLRWDPPNPLPEDEPREWRPWHPGGGLPPDPSMPVAQVASGRVARTADVGPERMFIAAPESAGDDDDDGDGGPPGGGGGGGGDQGEGLSLDLEEMRARAVAEAMAKSKEQQPRPVVEPPHQLVPAAGPSVTIPPTPGPPVAIKRTAVDRESGTARRPPGASVRPGSTVGGPEDPARAAKLEQDRRTAALLAQDQASRRFNLMDKLQPVESVAGDNTKARNPGESSVGADVVQMREAARARVLDSVRSPQAAMREQYSAAGASPPQSGAGFMGRLPLTRVATGHDVKPPKFTRAQLRVGNAVLDPDTAVAPPEVASADAGEAVSPAENDAVVRSPIQPHGQVSGQGTPRDASAKTTAATRPSIMTPDATVATTQGSRLHGAAATTAAQYPSGSASGFGTRSSGLARQSDPFQFTSLAGPTRRGGGGGGPPPGTYDLVAAMQGVQDARDLRDAAGPRVDASARSAGRDILTALDGVEAGKAPVQGLTASGAAARGGYALDVLGPVASRLPTEPTKPTKPAKPVPPNKIEGYEKLGVPARLAAFERYEKAKNDYPEEVRKYEIEQRDYLRDLSVFKAQSAEVLDQRLARSTREQLVSDLEQGATRAEKAQDAYVDSVGDLVSAKQAIADKYGEKALAQAMRAAEQIVDRQVKSDQARSVGNKARAAARIVKLVDGMGAAVQKAVGRAAGADREEVAKAAYQSQADSIINAAADLLFQSRTADRLSGASGNALDLMNLAQAQDELKHAESAEGRRAAREAGRRIPQHEKSLRAQAKQGQALDKRIAKLENVSSRSAAQDEALEKLKEERDALQKQSDDTQEKLAHDRRVAGQERSARNRVKLLKRLQKRSKLTRAQQRALDKVLAALSEARLNGAELPDWVDAEVDEWEKKNPDKVPPPKPDEDDDVQDVGGGGAQQPQAKLDPGCESCKPPKDCPQGPYQCMSNEEPVGPEHLKVEPKLEPSGASKYRDPQGLKLPDLDRPKGGPIQPPVQPADSEPSAGLSRDSDEFEAGGGGVDHVSPGYGPRAGMDPTGPSRPRVEQVVPCHEDGNPEKELYKFKTSARRTAIVEMAGQWFAEVGGERYIATSRTAAIINAAKAAHDHISPDLRPKHFVAPTAGLCWKPIDEAGFLARAQFWIGDALRGIGVEPSRAARLLGAVILAGLRKGIPLWAIVEQSLLTGEVTKEQVLDALKEIAIGVLVPTVAVVALKQALRLGPAALRALGKAGNQLADDIAEAARKLAGGSDEVGRAAHVAQAEREVYESLAEAADRAADAERQGTRTIVPPASPPEVAPPPSGGSRGSGGGSGGGGGGGGGTASGSRPDSGPPTVHPDRGAGSGPPSRGTSRTPPPEEVRPAPDGGGAPARGGAAGDGSISPPGSPEPPPAPPSKRLPGEPDVPEGKRSRVGRRDYSDRERSLGTEPGPRPKFREHEVECALELEKSRGPLRRANPDVPAERGADWVDQAGRTYEGWGPMPPDRFNPATFRDSIRGHVRKSVDHVVFDVRGLTQSQADAVASFAKSLDPRPGRVIIQGR